MVSDSSKDAGSKGKALKKPAIPSGKEIYDSIMSEIEPELVSDSLDTIEENCGGEPEEKKKERLRGYREAFKKYDKKYAEYMEGLTNEVNIYKKKTLVSLEEENEKKESEALSELESSIQSL